MASLGTALGRAIASGANSKEKDEEKAMKDMAREINKLKLTKELESLKGGGPRFGQTYSVPAGQDPTEGYSPKGSTPDYAMKPWNPYEKPAEGFNPDTDESLLRDAVKRERSQKEWDRRHEIKVNTRKALAKPPKEKDEIKEIDALRGHLGKQIDSLKKIGSDDPAQLRALLALEAKKAKLDGDKTKMILSDEELDEYAPQAQADKGTSRALDNSPFMSEGKGVASKDIKTFVDSKVGSGPGKISPSDFSARVRALPGEERAKAMEILQRGHPGFFKSNFGQAKQDIKKQANTQRSFEKGMVDKYAKK